MKKFIFMFALALVFAGSVSHASAAVVCDYPDHAIHGEDGYIIVGCITDVAWQKAVAEQVNQNDKNDFIKVGVGQHLLTTYGFEDMCPSWFPPSGCVIKKAIFVKFL